MTERPYLSAEDSRVLREALQGLKGERSLEMGAGNGGNLKILAEGFELVAGTDLISPSMLDWREGGTDFVIADRACCFRDASFDLVAFNPPYLLTDGVVDRTVDGGRMGEIPLGFLKEAVRVVKGTGRIMMILDGETPLGEFRRALAAKGFSLKVLTARQLFFEKLVLYECERADSDMVRTAKDQS